MEQVEYSIIKLPHGYFNGGIYETNYIPTIDTGVGCWHILIGERKIQKVKSCDCVGMLKGGKWDNCIDSARRVYSTEQASPTLTTCGGGNQEVKIVEPTALDEQNGYLRKDGTVGTIVTDGSSPKHNNRIVEPINYIKKEEILLTIFDLCGIIDVREIEKYETSRKLLQLLWEEITKKEIWEEIGRFWCFSEKKILRQKLYENGLSENRGKQSNISNCSSNCGEYNEKLEQRKKMFNMWENWKVRYTPFRWELSKQQFEQFNIFMQKLSYETTQGKEHMQDLRKTNESIKPLQQTLYSLSKIWRPELYEKQSQLRIRKLTPREAFRLMGVKDEDFERVAKNQSKSSLYHLAGDSIITNCLMAIFKEML